jgi:hypothetical protein
MEKRAVVVTTEWRGVFFGFLEDDTNYPARIVLSDARNCLYWDSASKGVLGLAAKGPSKSSRIGPKVPKADLVKLTGIFECTPEAVKAWESEPWR